MKQYRYNQFGLIEDGNGLTFPAIDNHTDVWREYKAFLDAGGITTPYNNDPQLSKSLDLKKAENRYIAYLTQMATQYSLTLTPGMTREQLLTAAQAAGLAGYDLLDARQTVMELLNDVNVNGGRYGDITYHPEAV